MQRGKKSCSLGQTLLSLAIIRIPARRAAELDAKEPNKYCQIELEVEQGQLLINIGT